MFDGQRKISIEPNNLSFEDLTALLLKGPPLKTYTITIPEGLWISETLETLSAQTGYEVIQLENSLTSGQVVSKYLTPSLFALSIVSFKDKDMGS